MCKQGEGKKIRMWVEIDKCLIPLVETLNKYGIETSSCCCGHGEKSHGKKINNYIVLLTNNAELGIADKDGVAQGWESPSKLNVWAVAFPVEKKK